MKKINPWFLLVLALISTAVSVMALRANNLHMVKLRDAVYAADKDNSDVQGALKNLQAYVTRHMNTSLSSGNNSVYPPIQLKYTYERLKAAQQGSDTSSQLYTEAQKYCEAQNSRDFSGRNRVPCIQQYIQSHGGQANPQPNIPDSLYKFDFASPRWSPDFAGWSLLVAMLFWLALVIRVATGWVVPRIR